MAELIDGRALASDIRRRVEAQLQRLAAAGVSPSLVAVEVGQDPASDLYVRRQARACSQVNLPFERVTLPPDTTESALVARLAELGQEPTVTGVILQMPLPAHINARRVRRALTPEKDVEGVHPQNLGWLLSDRPSLIPCTAAAAMECVESTGVVLRGAHAVVVGHSETVGKPVALLLMERLATVTVCHHGTRDLPQMLATADIVVVAVGKPGLVRGEHLRPGAVVVDVGINEISHPDGTTEVVGDVDQESARLVASWITPVPGGVGPVTVEMLLRNTAIAAERTAL